MTEQFEHAEQRQNQRFQELIHTIDQLELLLVPKSKQNRSTSEPEFDRPPKGTRPDPDQKHIANGQSAARIVPNR